MGRLILVAALAGVTALTVSAEAGSSTSAFGVSAEVVRRCAIDTGGAKSPDVTCVKGTLTPRIGRLGAPAPSAPALAPAPRTVETAPREDGTVRVSVDF
jgi:hypothetical protein